MNVPILTPLAFTADGIWDLHNDTLGFQLDSATAQILTYDFDLSNLPKSYLKTKKDSLDMMVEFHKNMVLYTIKERVAPLEIHQASISKTGNMMFWEDHHILPWGEDQVNKVQFMRK